MRTFISTLLLLTSFLPAQDVPRPAEVVANSATFIGKRATWVGKQVRISTTLLNGRRVVTNRVFALLDAKGKEDRTQIFAVEGSATETAAARKLNGPDDQGVRRVTGIIGQVGDIEVYIDGKPRKVRGPMLTEATLDAQIVLNP